VRPRRDEFVALVRQLVEHESPSAVPAAFPPLFTLLESRLQPLGWRCRRLPGRRTGGAFLARPERRGPYQLVVGHLDTVWPVGTLAEMPWNESGDVLRGPGVFDMKAGVAQALLALQHLGPCPLTPVLFLNTDEELGSFESARWLRRLARGARRAFVLEPALGPEGRLKTRRKGVGGFEVVVHGRAAHAGLAPEEGASAILELAHVVQQLFALNDPERGVSVNVGTIEGGLRSNVVAPRSQAKVDVRVPSQREAEQVAQAIFGLRPTVAGVRLEIRGGFGRPPLEPTPRNRRLWEQARRLAAEMGLELGEGLAGGGSDGSLTSLYTATLDGLGAVGDGAHAQHEQIRVTPSLQRASLLAALLQQPEEEEESCSTPP